LHVASGLQVLAQEATAGKTLKIKNKGRREGGKEGRREGGKEGRREGGKEGMMEGRNERLNDRQTDGMR